MGDEIETYILKKLQDAIAESEKIKIRFAAKMLLPNFHKEFTELKLLVENKQQKIKLAAIAAAAAAPPPPAVKKLPDASRPSGPASTPAAAANKDSKLPEAPPAGGSKKESDEKETGASENAGDEKEKGEADASLDDDKKETDAHDDDDDDDDDDKESSADVDGGKKEDSEAPEIDDKDSGAPASLATTSAKAAGPEESNVGSTGKSTGGHVSEISPATDDVTGDKSITTTGEKEAAASKAAALAKPGSPDKSEISAVKDNGAREDKPKALATAAGGGGKAGGGQKPPSEEDSLREQLYYINNLLTEWQMITQNPFSYPSIKEFTDALKKIKQGLKDPPKRTDESSHAGTRVQTTSIVNVSVPKTTPEVVEYRWSTRVNPNKVHGFEDKILSLERLLVLRRKDTDTFKAFGIHGMAGVGKTTLCQSIFSRPKVTEYFFPRIWVCLSKQEGEDENNRKEVVKRMLRCVGIDDKIINKIDEKQSIRGLLFALRLQLTGKRYFIVLDDAHNPDEWFKMPDSDAGNDKIYEKFSYGLPKEHGGTVLVTSRVEQVVRNMVGEEENLRCIEPLTDQETCWNIFKDTVNKGSDTEFPADLDKLRAEIVKRCDGLPLAAKLLGQIKHKELHESRQAAAKSGDQQAAAQSGNQQTAAQSGNHQAAAETAK